MFNTNINVRSISYNLDFNISSKYFKTHLRLSLFVVFVKYCGQINKKMLREKYCLTYKVNELLYYIANYCAYFSINCELEFINVLCCNHLPTEDSKMQFKWTLT